METMLATENRIGCSHMENVEQRIEMERWREKRKGGGKMTGEDNWRENDF